MIVVPVLVGLLATLAAARNARVAVRVDDGACPIGDGQTQEGKTVSITCVYNIDVPLEFEHKTKMKFEKYGLSSLVAIKTGLSETFSNPSKYYITEVKEGAYATRLDIRGVTKSDAGIYRCLFYKENVVLASAEKRIEVFSDSNKVFLTVGGEESDSFKVEAGKSYMVGCTAYGPSKPTMTIKLGSQQILTLQVGVTANGAGYEGSGRYTFAEGDNNKNLSCEAKVTSFPDAVIDSASLEVVAICCREDVILVADKDGMAAFNRSNAGKMHTMMLPLGTYSFRTSLGSSLYQWNVTVVDHRIRYRLMVEVDYQMNCTEFDENRQFIHTKHHNDEIEKLCDGLCHVLADNVTLNCTGDVVTITWPTDVVYRGDTITVPKEVSNRIYGNMRGQIAILQIFVMTKIPRVIYPRRNEINMRARLRLERFEEEEQLTSQASPQYHLRSPFYLNLT